MKRTLLLGVGFGALTLFFTNMSLVSVTRLGEYLAKETGSGLGTDLHRFAGANFATSGYQNTLIAFSPTGIMANRAKFGLPKTLVTSVKEQGDRGTCTAFATLSALESAIGAKNNVNVNLSEQHLHFMRDAWPVKTPRDWTWTYAGGDGYFTQLHLENLKQTGHVVPFEKTWNYKPFSYCPGYATSCSQTWGQGKFVCAASGQCSYVSPVPAKRDGVKLTGYTQHFNPSWTAEKTVDTLIGLLALEQSVIIGMELHEDFFTGNYTGYVQSPISPDYSASRFGHAMHAVAFVSNTKLRAAIPTAPLDPAGKGYVVMKNSWSVSFGDQGYYYVPTSYFLRQRYNAPAYASTRKADWVPKVITSMMSISSKNIVSHTLGTYTFHTISGTTTKEVAKISQLTEAEALSKCEAKATSLALTPVLCKWNNKQIFKRAGVYRFVLNGKNTKERIVGLKKGEAITKCKAFGHKNFPKNDVTCHWDDVVVLSVPKAKK